MKTEEWEGFLKECDKRLKKHVKGEICIIALYAPTPVWEILNHFVAKGRYYQYFTAKYSPSNEKVMAIDLDEQCFLFDYNRSQHHIEKYLNKFFDKPGTFLEIGCWDGQMISQTVRLEQDKGWSGLCVDPFAKNFGQRKCKLCKKAVSKDGKPREFIHVTIDRRYGGDVSYFSGFTEAVKANLPLIEEHCDYTNEVIGTITVQQLYEQYNLPEYIEFLSVDTEGSELEIFQSIDFQKVSFGLIVFEHNRDEEVKKAIGDILTANKYVLHESLEVDDIYINPDKL
jgi:hypothetical protein